MAIYTPRERREIATLLWICVAVAVGLDLIIFEAVRRLFAFIH